ncbi:hypothetical protein BJX70DRAFT_366891 [Aspergillus crustosus]
MTTPTPTPTPTTSQLSALEALLKSHPSIIYTPPTSPSFSSAARVWNNSRHAANTPLAVVQPQSPSDVAALIEFTKQTSIPFTIRAGGHNLEGKALVDKALLIDLRAFTSVAVAEDRKSATVGGGILQQELGNRLWEEGLATPTGAVPAVGYVGWAIYGGYGPFSSHWGLGVDQIIGATVVTADGEIVAADEERLQGIRGAGGVFGVILDLKIKVYPLTGFLAGAIIFDSTEIPTSFTTFNANYKALLATTPPPAQLSLQQIVVNSPHGPTFAAIFVWSGDAASTEEGLSWSTKIGALAPLVVNTVAPTTIPDWFRGNEALVPENVYGSSWTFDVVFPVSPSLVKALAQNLGRLPSDPVAMFSLHELRAVSPSVGDQAGKSVFSENARQPHYMIEILGFATTDEAREASQVWGARTAEEAEGVARGEGTLLPSVYISLYDSANASSADGLLEMVYGEKKEALKELARRFDPEGVFRLAVPEI